MADNVVASAAVGTGATFACAELSFSGDTVVVPGNFVGILSGSEGAWTFSLIVGGAGDVAAGVQRMTLASDDPAVVALQIIDNAISGSEMQVDVVAALPAGTNNIGDVDVLSIIPGTGATNLGKAIDTATGGTDTGVLALATRDDALSGLTPAEGDNVQLRTDASGALWVIPSGTITVASHAVTNAGTFAVQAAQSGTWTVDLGATDNAVLDNIDADLTTIIGHVDGLEGLLTTIDSDTGGIITAVQLIDNVIYVDDADWTAATSSHALIGGIYQSTPGAITDGDTGPLRLTENGAAHVSVVNTVTVASHAVTNAGTFATQAVCTNAGTFAVQVDGSALTALQLIDDVIATLGTTTYTETTTKGAIIGAVRRDADTTLVDTTNEIGPLQMNANGALKVEIFDGGDSHTVDYATTGSGNATGALRVELANNGTGVLATVGAVTAITNALPAGTNAIGKLAANSGVDIGDVDVTSISAGTNTIGNVGLIGRTSGGMTIFRSIDIDETEEEIKASAGQVFSIAAFNRTAAPLYLKFYNATAANVTVGTTTPVLTFVVPGNADSDGAGFMWNNDIGFAFGTAITVACTTGVADNDTGAPGANECLVNVGYT
jgi:hypothetical protein